jgi:hypothetical protein
VSGYLIRLRWGRNVAVYGCEPDSPSRRCSRIVSHVQAKWMRPGEEGADAYIECGEEAVLHALFGQEAESGAELRGYACHDHVEAIARTMGGEQIVDVHALGDDCGMPGAVWVEGEPSRCVSDFIPEFSGELEAGEPRIVRLRELAGQVVE